MDINTITPMSMVKNEDYWIGHVIKDVVKVFGRMIILDTGSNDRTKEIIKLFPEVTLIEENYGDDANRIGNGRNVLREKCPTETFFLIDGDEIWREDMLLKLLSLDLPDDKVIMLGTCELQDVDGKIKMRKDDFVNRDRLFPPWVKWHRCDYPFESYGLNDYLSADKVQYVNAREIYAYHVRHTIRSSKNSEAFFRDKKFNYFPYEGEFEDLPDGWLVKDERFWNPYL